MKDGERMIVSAWTDGEVEAPWDRQVASRVESYPAWGEEARRHQAVKEALAHDAEPSWEAAQQRVWERVNQPQGAARRPVALPWGWLSVAAAAVLVLAAGGGYWMGQSAASQAVPAVAELKVQVPKQLELKLSGEGQLIMASTLQGNGP